MADLRGVVTASAGRDFSDGDLQQVARNFNLLSRGARPLHRVPVGVFGDGAEAYAWVVGVRASGGVLLSDWEDVAPSLRAAVLGGRGEVVAELRQDFRAPDGRTFRGPYLYRVQVTGAHVPAPARWFSDGPAPVHFGGASMDPQEARDFLAGLERPCPIVDGLSDDDAVRLANWLEGLLPDAGEARRQAHAAAQSGQRPAARAFAELTEAARVTLAARAFAKKQNERESRRGA